MASNGSHQNSDTAVFLAKTELEGESKANKNLDNVDDWLSGHVNVQNEIWRGKKLREKKPKADVTEKEYIVPNIHFFECFVKQPRVRKGHVKIFKNNTSQSAPRSKCPCTRTTTAASSYLATNRLSRTTIQTKAKKGKRCPMRIVELAVPTKRQCIETWRNKSDVLPQFMVERLKQHVMDQIPIVKIPEAIYCFQNRKRVSSKNCSFRWLSSKHEPKETLKFSNHMDARMLSTVFAHKVAKRLARPINLTINSDLEKLSAIVSSDITKIMSKCQCTTTKGRQYKAIQSDVSNKITVWITGILEDLSIKLLEEDLKVKTETAALIKTMLEFSERVVTIIEPIIEQQNYMKSQDLEEEEGPVLDFIDDVVFTVMNVCEPPQLHIDTDSNLSGSTKDVLLGEESEKPVETIESASDKMSKLEELFKSETSSRVLTEETDDGNENLTDSEHFQNEISNIIDNMITKESGDDMSNGSGDDIENGSIDDENEENSTKAEMEHNTNDENNQGISPEAGIEHDINGEILPEAGLEHDVNDENNDEILPEAEKKQDDEYNEGISPEAGIAHDVNDEILPEAGLEHDVNDENNDGILPEVEKKQDDEYNEGISPEAGIGHDINEEILPKAGLEHDVNDENNDEILPEAENKPDDENNEGISSEAGIDHDLNDEILPEAEKQQDIKDENNVRISPEAGIDHETNEQNLDQIVENGPNVNQNDEDSENAAETHTNVSECFEIFTDDSDDDKNSKKLMCPKKDLVNPDNPADQNKTREDLREKWCRDVGVEYCKVYTMYCCEDHFEVSISEALDFFVWNRHRNPMNINEPNGILPTNKFNIKFAEPNQHLLCDADESWPAELGDKPMLKVSDSASKSVLSLGRITESYEMQMSSEDEDSMTDKGTGDTILQVNDIREKIYNIFVTEKHDTASQPSEPLIKVYKETSTPESGETQVDSKILDEKDMGKTITVPKSCDDKPVDESCKLEENQTDSGESELIRTGSTTVRTEDDEILSHKSQSRVDYGWKVHPKTAPSWVISWGQGRGEPSEDSIPIQIRPTKVSEIELRKWCKELEKAFTNLDMWSNWISATCKEGLFVLQQKELNCPVLAQKGAINWMRLKRNVHKDALLWTKLYQRTDKHFKSLKNKYNNMEFSSNKMPSVLNRTIFEKMREFEELSAKLHKMIVAAEYCAMCTCDKATSRHHSNKEYLGYRTK